MENFTLDIGDDGVAIVTFDVPGRSMNTITQAVQRELGVLADRIAGDDAIKGAVLRSGKASGFCAGGDVVEMAQAFTEWRAAESQDDLRAGVEGASSYSRNLRALETCGKPVAAAIEGLALGGGLELALACPIRVASDDPKLRLGLPEATIGLMPGAGGTQRLPRIMGISAALPFLVEGRPLPIDQAVATGVLTAVVPVDEVVARCRALVLASTEAGAPWDQKGFRLPGGGPHSAAGYRSFPGAIAALVGSHGPQYPAIANILRAVYEGCELPMDAGLRVESRYFFNTVRTPQAAAMVNTMFTARRTLGRAPIANTEAYVARLQKAWTEAAGIEIAGGVPRNVVIGAARAAGGWPLTPSPSGQRDVHLPDPDTVAIVMARMLASVAAEAERCLIDGLLPNVTAADVVAVDAGFPAWTGGPVSYARNRLR